MKIMTTGTLEVVVLAQVEGLNPSPQLPENVSQRTFEIHLHNEDTGARGVLRVGTQSGKLLGGWLSHGDDEPTAAGRAADRRRPGRRVGGHHGLPRGNWGPAVKVELCGAKNPDYPSEYACELFAGHGRVRPNDPNEHPDNWYAHAAPSEGAWWNLPEDPMTEDNSGLTVEPVTRPDDPLEPARLARIAQLSRALVSYGLTGRWSWAGTLTSGYHLRTKANGGRWVMGAQNVHEHYEVDADGDGGRVVPTDCTGAAGTDACSAGYRDQQAQDRPVPAFAVREPDSPWTTIRPASGIPIFSVCPRRHLGPRPPGVPGRRVRVPLPRRRAGGPPWTPRPCWPSWRTATRSGASWGRLCPRWTGTPRRSPTRWR
jgi:hypothetical protein